MGAAPEIRTDLARPAQLRMLAIASALEGKSRRRCATQHLLKNDLRRAS